jgi:hydroxymethylglutaryl-CoA reductase
MPTKLFSQLKDILTEEQLQELSELKKISNPESRQFELKKFFINPLVFNKVSHIQDPTWLAYDIFINGKQYEF